MILTDKQERGLRIAVQRFNDHERYTVISGYAGTGKSTLVKFIVQNLPGINPEEDVVYATFTGKAAQVLLKKGNPNVMTLHKLLYDSVPKPDGTFIRKRKVFIDYSVVIVDEVSMAPKYLMDILFSHDIYVIALGDPFQLPPVDKDQDNGLLQRPHVFLDEIMRQEADSEIIQLSMKIRNFEPIDNFKGSDVIVMDKKDLNTGMLQWADQILVGTNAVRMGINNQMRNLLGRGDKPENGDKIICLKNYWESFADNGDPLVNGTIGYIDSSYETFNRLPYWCDISTVDVLEAVFISDSDANYGRLQMDEKQILTGEKSIDFRTTYRLMKNWRTQHLVPMDFTYAYAITGHKAQGSEWDKVLVMEEKFPFSKQEHARWLYTCCTRASSKLVLAR